MCLPLRLLAALALAAAALCSSGCVAFYWPRDIPVTVLDAETGEPVAGADVAVSYTYMLVLNAPRPQSATTNKQGETTIRAANFHAGWTLWTVSAPGYLSAVAFPSGRRWIPSEFHPPLEKVADRRAEIRLYRAVEPTITILVPDGYRGPLWVHRRPTRGWIQEAAGKRDFTFRADDNGYVGIDATPLLLRSPFPPAPPPDPRVRHEDGSEVPPQGPDTRDADVAVRRIAREGHERRVYMVGTQADAEAMYPLVYEAYRGNPGMARTSGATFAAMFPEPAPAGDR